MRSLADARLQAAGAGRLPALEGALIAGDAVLLEPVRSARRVSGGARLRLLTRAGARRDGRRPRRPGRPVAVEARASGRSSPSGARVTPLSRAEAFQRPRGAAMALDVGSARATGRRRAGRGRRRSTACAAAPSARWPPGRRGPRPALLRGMVLGQDEAIDAPVREEFRRSGLAHLVAASGQNVLLLALLAIAAASALGAGLRARLAVALVLVALYVPLAGGGPSIQRAGVMGAAGLVAALAGRPASRWYALGLAAAVTLLVNPRAAQEPGWQLSFAAVLALLALAPVAARLGSSAAGGRAPRPTPWRSPWRRRSGTAPLMALHFGTLSLASLPANLLAAPAVAPVMWLGTLAAAAGQLSRVAGRTVERAGRLPRRLRRVGGARGGGARGGERRAPAPGPGGARRRLRRARRRHGWPRAGSRGGAHRPAPPPGLGRRRAGLRLRGRGSSPAPRPGRPTARAASSWSPSCDVGQGDATLLQRDDAAVLVDTGPPGGPILRELRAAGVGRLDALVLTHAQADHEGMAEAVLREHPARLVLNGGAGGGPPVQRRSRRWAARSGARLEPARAGQRIRFGRLELRVLWPPPAQEAGAAAAGDPNDRAVVAHVRLGGFDLLLPADAESGVTAAARPAGGRRGQGRPPRQRRPRARPRARPPAAALRRHRGGRRQHLRAPRAVDARGAARRARGGADGPRRDGAPARPRAGACAWSATGEPGPAAAPRCVVAPCRRTRGRRRCRRHGRGVTS